MSEHADTPLSGVKAIRAVLRQDGLVLPLPNWAEWMIGLGDWVYAKSKTGVHQVIIVRTPSRRTASAFAALGALIAAARCDEDTMAWSTLHRLPPRTKVYWREDVSGRVVNRDGQLLGRTEVAGQEFLSIEVPGKRGGIRHLSREQVAACGLTLRRVSEMRDAELTRAERIVGELTSTQATGWLHKPRAEVVVITERSSFLADIDGIELGAQSGEFEPLSTFLSPGWKTGKAGGKIRLLPPRSVDPVDRTPVAILDGSHALRRVGELDSSVVIVLVEPSEYDEEADNLLHSFMMHNEGSAAPDLPESVVDAPFGVELGSFILFSTGGHCAR